MQNVSNNVSSEMHFRELADNSMAHSHCTLTRNRKFFGTSIHENEKSVSKVSQRKCLVVPE